MSALRKVHCYWYSTFFAVHAVCNRSELDGDLTFARRGTWPWIPTSARCKRCHGFNGEHLVTPEIECAIESALHGIASVLPARPWERGSDE